MKFENLITLPRFQVWNQLKIVTRSQLETIECNKILTKVENYYDVNATADRKKKNFVSYTLKLKSIDIFHCNIMTHTYVWTLNFSCTKEFTSYFTADKYVKMYNGNYVLFHFLTKVWRRFWKLDNFSILAKIFNERSIYTYSRNATKLFRRLLSLH